MEINLISILLCATNLYTTKMKPLEKRGFKKGKQGSFSVWPGKLLSTFLESSDPKYAANKLKETVPR